MAVGGTAIDIAAGAETRNADVAAALEKYTANDIYYLFGRVELPMQLVEKFGSVDSALSHLQIAAQGVATSAYEAGAWVSVKEEPHRP